MPPRSRTTDRSITTCRPCRRRKIRCDRGRPSCNKCRESGASCIYEDQAPRTGREYQFVEEMPGRVPEQRPAGSQVPSDRLEDIETLIDRIQRTTRDLRIQSGGEGAQTSDNQESGSRRESTATSQATMEEQWKTLQKDAAQLNDLISRPLSGTTSPRNNPSPSDQLTRETLEAESSSSLPQQMVFDPMLDVMASPPHIDWTYIDEVINGMQDQSGQQPAGDPE